MKILFFGLDFPLRAVKIRGRRLAAPAPRLVFAPGLPEAGPQRAAAPRPHSPRRVKPLWPEGEFEGAF